MQFEIVVGTVELDPCFTRAIVADNGDTIRIKRPPKVVTDALGHNVWMSEVEPCELELVVPVQTNPYDKGVSFDR